MVGCYFRHTHQNNKALLISQKGFVPSAGVEPARFPTGV
jgi:hypothetical protein